METDKTLEFTFASSLFTLDMFIMGSNSEVTKGDTGILESARYEVEDGLKVTLPFEVKTGSVFIRNAEEADSVSEGKFKVEITAATEDAPGKTEITFSEGDVAVGDTLRVSYIRRVVAADTLAVRTDSTSARGAFAAHWNVYSSGIDCTDANLKGILHLYLYRARVSALPGFDTSYKSAATNSITVSAIDPRRADKRMYKLIYEHMDTNGDIINKSGDTVNWA
jgi:hypothetical protein